MRLVVALLATIVAVGISWRFARSTITDIGGFLVTVAVASITWNQVKPFAIPLSDLLFLLSVVPVVITLLRGRSIGRFPLLCVSGALLVGLAILLNAVLPVSQTYTDSRYAAAPPKGIAQHHGPHVFADLIVGLKLQIGLLIMPIAIMAVARTRDQLRDLFDVWGISAVIDAGVAALDGTGLTHISFYLRGHAGSREAGLTNHENHLATVCVIAIPVVLNWWRRGGRWRLASILATLLLADAIVLSGSRAGIVAGGIIVVAAVMTRHDVRRAVMPIALPVVLIAGAIFLLDRSVVHDILSHTRFGSQNAAASDAVREQAHLQAVSDFHTRPLQGIGFQVADEGHSIYLQILASGGLLTALGLALYVGGVVYQTRIRLRDAWWSMEIAGLIGLLGWLTLGAVQNDFADRYPYVPAAMLIAVAANRARWSDDPSTPSVDLSGRSTIPQRGRSRVLA